MQDDLWEPHKQKLMKYKIKGCFICGASFVLVPFIRCRPAGSCRKGCYDKYLADNEKSFDRGVIEMRTTKKGVVLYMMFSGGSGMKRHGEVSIKECASKVSKMHYNFILDKGFIPKSSIFIKC